MSNLFFDILILIYKILISYILAIYRLFVSPRPKNIQNKLVLITGAAQGIGRQMALEFARYGTRLALLDINQTLNGETLMLIQELNANGKIYKCDVTNKAEVDKVIDTVTKEMGEVDILVNNAGIMTCKDILDLDEKEIRKTIDVNLLSLFWTSKSILPSMLDKKAGHIVNICSMAAKTGCPLCTDYCASKYAVDGFSEALQEDLKRRGCSTIQLTTVYPMFVNTNLISSLSHRIYHKYRFGQLLNPDEVAKEVVKGTLRNERYIFIPSYIRFTSILDFLPLNGRRAFKEFFEAAFYEKSE